MEEVERHGWTSKHQNTEMDIQDLDIKQVLNVEFEEPPQQGRKVEFWNILIECNFLKFGREGSMSNWERETLQDLPDFRTFWRKYSQNKQVNTK